jgi:phage/plasmid-like protein (TIGR03299 family)
MAHAIDTSVNAVGAFIARLFPGWHGLGFTKTAEQILATGEINMEEVLESGRGIGYHVERVDLVTKPLDGSVGTAGLYVPGYKGLIRTDTMRVLSVVSETYHVVQHVPEFKAFWEILKDKGYLIETAGVLDEGQRTWILFKRPETVSINQRDPLKGFLLAMFEYGTGQAMSVKLVAERVVCSNTAAIALGESGEFDFRIKHFKTATARLDTVRQMLQGADSAFESYVHKVERLAAAPFTEDEVKTVMLKVLAEAFGDPTEAGISRENQERIVLKSRLGAAYLTEALTNDRQAIAGLGTKWALYNAVSEWADHVVAPGRSKDPRKANESRFKSQLEGKANRIKQEAFSLLSNVPMAA